MDLTRVEEEKEKEKEKMSRRRGNLTKRRMRTWWSCTDSKEMYLKACCTCKIVVLLFEPFFHVLVAVALTIAYLAREHASLHSQ